MAPTLHAVTRPMHQKRMLEVILVMGAAVGLHLGLLHLFLWKNAAAPITFFVSALAFAGVAYALQRWVFPRLTRPSLGAEVALETLAATLAFGALSVAVASTVAYLLGAPQLIGTPIGPEEHVTVTPAIRQSAVRMYALLPIVPTVLSSLVGYHLVWRRMESLQTRAEELRDLAATAQLAALRAQINPHFLFNSLNSIAQLIHVDPTKAEACVERLAEIFRYLLHRAEQEFVPLADELQMTTAYLEIERARFDERLRVETRVDPQSLRQLIPNLLLQPLVENAVKHGLSRKVGPGTLHIDVRVDGETLTLVVGDDGLGMTAAVLDSVYERGVGLRNLRARLERLYGPAHLPEITSTPGRGTRVAVRLPVREPRPLEAA